MPIQPQDSEFKTRLRQYVEAAGGVSQEMTEHAARSARMTMLCYSQLPSDCQTLLDLRRIVDARFGHFTAAIAQCAGEAPDVGRFERVAALMADAIDASTGLGDGTVMLSDCLCRGFELLAQNPFVHDGVLRPVGKADAKRMVAAYMKCVEAFGRLNSTLGGCFGPGGVSVLSSAVRERLRGHSGVDMVRRLFFDGPEDRPVFTPMCFRELADGLGYMTLSGRSDESLAAWPVWRDEELLYDFMLFMMVVSRRAATSNVPQFRRNLERALDEVRTGAVGKPPPEPPVAHEVVRRPRATLVDRRVSERLVVVSGMIRWRAEDGSVHVAKCSAKPSVEILNTLFGGKRGGVRLTASEISQLRRNVRAVGTGDFVSEVLSRVRDEERLKGGPFYRVTLRNFYA